MLLIGLRGESLCFLPQKPFHLSPRVGTIFELTEVDFQLILSYRFLLKKKQNKTKKKPQQSISDTCFILHVWFFSQERWSELISESLCHFLHRGKLVYFPWRTRCLNAHQAVCVSACILQWLMVSAAKMSDKAVSIRRKGSCIDEHTRKRQQRATWDGLTAKAETGLWVHLVPWAYCHAKKPLIHTNKMMTNIKVL